MERNAQDRRVERKREQENERLRLENERLIASQAANRVSRGNINGRWTPHEEDKLREIILSRHWEDEVHARRDEIAALLGTKQERGYRILSRKFMIKRKPAVATTTAAPPPAATPPPPQLTPPPLPFAYDDNSRRGETTC